MDDQGGQDELEAGAALPVVEDNVDMESSNSESEVDSDGDGLAAFMWGRRYAYTKSVYIRTCMMYVYKAFSQKRTGKLVRPFHGVVRP